MDLISMQFQDISKAELYIRSMLPSRKGLPCWHPRPRGPFVGENGIVPGDVGTFSAADGFNKIFNLWDDERIRKLSSPEGTYEPPSREIIVYQDELAEGDTIVDGTSSKIYRTPDGRFVFVKFFSQIVCLSCLQVGYLVRVHLPDTARCHTRLHLFSRPGGAC